jgi:TolB-like protein
MMSDATQDLICGELARILASPEFDASERNRRFLSYVVEETLAGRGDRIKAYSIATGAFGRSENFDPQQDSIVRIEAARLRRALEHFYLRQHGPAGIRISIPKGSYVPEFSEPSSPPDALAQEQNLLLLPQQREAMHRLAPRILVSEVDEQGATELFPALGRALTRQLIATLTRFTELFVYGFETTEMIQGDMPLAERLPLAIDYRLFSTATLSPETLQVELLLQDARDGRYVWAQDLTRDLSGGFTPARIITLCAEIAGEVARVLALRDGIFDSQARENVGNAPHSLLGYQKLLDFHDYWRTLDPALFHPLRRDLEAAVAEDPHFASALACLSLLYSDAVRYGYDVSDTCAAPLERARALAQQAIRLVPNSSCAHHAKAVAEWFSGNPEASLATLQVARALNPNNPELLAELGFRYAMRMEWDRAVPLIEEAYDRNPMQSGQYRMGLFLYHFAHGRFALALQEAQAINAPGIAFVHVAKAVALSSLGRRDEADASLRDAVHLWPGLLARLPQELTFRQIHPEQIDAILAAIDKINPGTGLDSLSA